MSKKYKRTNTTITLSLNFNNEYEYGFTVDIDPREFTWKQVQELIGKNCSQEKFELRDLGPVLINLLVEFGHATSSSDDDDERDPWNVLAERRSAPR